MTKDIMRLLLVAIMLFSAAPALSDENIIHDDGTGAQISFWLPTHGKKLDRKVVYTTYRIIVTKDDKYLLFTDLCGIKTDDGKTFFGKIIIPSEMIDSAEIVMLGFPANSSLGVHEKLKVSDFKRTYRNKSWTVQK